MSIDTDARPGAGRSPALDADPAAPPATELPRLAGRRDPKWIALGVVALCLGALLSYVVYANVASETTVVSVARTVYRGEVLEADDLTTVRLQGGALPDAVPASGLDGLVGQRAVYDLPSGSVVAATSVAATALPADGRSVVGILLPGGHAPQGLLLPSSPVRLVALPPASSSTAAKDQLAGKTYAARVVDTAPAPDGTSTMVDVDVPQAQAATVALLAASQRLAVVRDAGR
ncbi:SAF domain-containing protein [uncultured Friedmanniella sp.]|uniref:SAF domain-containing protein n=1 Tax=uncultured Friedmanniella sp. TaxID=335381 RepID=UPI0035C97C19